MPISFIKLLKKNLGGIKTVLGFGEFYVSIYFLNLRHWVSQYNR